MGGPGRDSLDATCREAATTITLDGQANDGSDGEGDNVGSDIEVFEGSDGGTRFVGDDGANVFKGGDGPSEVSGGAGDDELYGGVEDDRIDGGPGDDVVMGYGGGDTIDGGTGADQVEGEGGSTISDGTGGPDRITTADGFQDTVTCGSGADSLVADSLDIIAAPGFSGTCEQVTIVSAGGSGGPAGGVRPAGPARWLGAGVGATAGTARAQDRARQARRCARPAALRGRRHVPREALAAARVQGPRVVALRDPGGEDADRQGPPQPRGPACAQARPQGQGDRGRDDDRGRDGAPLAHPAEGLSARASATWPPPITGFQWEGEHVLDGQHEQRPELRPQLVDPPCRN